MRVQINEVNINHARTLNKILFHHMLSATETKDHRSHFVTLKLDETFQEEPKRACPPCGTVTIPDYNFPGQFSELVRC